MDQSDPVLSHRSRAAVEWPTLSVLIVTYGLWAFGTTTLYTLSPVLAVIVTALAITQYSSLQHEALHGHPFQTPWLNEALVFPALFPTVPYGRFRATHLAHHHDPILTDPYDDPESNYLDPVVWARQPRWMQHVLSANNTLLGRMVIGPLIGTIFWLRSEARLLRHDRAVQRDWLLHLGGLALLVLWLAYAPMGWVGYLIAFYIAAGLLKIRTYLEHRAHEAARARTVVVEDRGPLALLFLNNNLHVVHHMHPQVAWYRLPALYAANRDHYLRRNDGYAYRSYAQIFARHFFRAKDPVPHPLMQADAAYTIRRNVGVVPELSKNGTP
ncbi:MAG: fatty acid desaturase [Pseudotabrizicola sp.]|uniref:fatty acid desaturase n=1 Tax=Pseudotabrizicola sp. TaxID=2939647 RepID=UPI0027261444|nr:fatty acid desaturase [Pseudotabrizicola sp.]MDO8881924.1 fatty acid desaturase [Pseudotabrizicola sp.]MDP2080463.1 fatty acid desaturase [Pseudotabrizicola sp.]MDZ7573692.1 fatty acid desaturase [Pseudotabrizicola sp.]